MPGSSQLGLYNKALRHLGERKLASLSENREPRRVLDDIYSDALNYCLGQGYWNHAMRTVQIDHDTGIDPPFGLTYAFAKPSDWIRTYQIASDQDFNSLLVKYTDEAQYWYASVDPIFVSFVSNDASYGLDLSIWPDAFTEYVAGYLALTVCPTVTNSEEKLERIEKKVKTLRIDARAKDAMNEPPKFPPLNTWVRSRNFGNMNRSLWDGRS